MIFVHYQSSQAISPPVILLHTYTFYRCTRVFVSSYRSAVILIMMPHFFFFWNVPDSWGALGLRAVPLFTGGWGGSGSSRCQLQYNKRWKVCGQNVSENARRHRSFVCEWSKAASNNFSYNNGSVINLSPLTGATCSFPGDTSELIMR